MNIREKAIAYRIALHQLHQDIAEAKKNVPDSVEFIHDSLSGSDSKLVGLEVVAENCWNVSIESEDGNVQVVKMNDDEMATAVGSLSNGPEFVKDLKLY